MTIFTLLSLLFLSVTSFAQVESASSEVSPESVKNKESVPHKDSLEALTPQERIEFLTAYQKALTDPSVQSTREITRMALHHAMLRADPSVETIIADMDARGPQAGIAVNRRNKGLGGNFQQWLANFPPSATTSLTTEEIETLKRAHAKALLDPSVQQARETAYLTFYNAITNADPLIGPLLAKAGMEKPSSVQPLSPKSPLGSEEKILGGNFQAWGEEILAPAIPIQETGAPKKTQ
ncbi:MAG: hypothetical protein ACOYK6_00640 [Chthoniobacterales bacterium]